MQGDTDERVTRKLPLDILLEVMDISQVVAAALMGACRILYALGPAYVLRQGVTLRTKSQMASFVSFMLADTRRLAYMRSLDLSADAFKHCRDVESHGALGASFADLLANPARALDTLILHDMEKMLTYNPRLLRAINGMTSLKRLGVYGVGRGSIEALRMVRSQLVSATVALVGPLGYTPALRGDSAFSSVFSVLQFSSGTLQELDLSLENSINLARDVPVTFQFPRVRTLRTVLGTHFPQCALIRLFPNLETLHLVPGEGSFGAEEHPYLPMFMSVLRDANAKIGLPPSFRLLECSAEVTSVYPLGAHLTVSKLRLRGYLRVRELPFFRVVLEETRPDDVEVDVLDWELAEELVGMLPELELGKLRVLRLTMNIPSRDMNAQQVMVEVRRHNRVRICA